MQVTTLGARLRAEREQKGFLQSKVAEHCGVKSAANISAWEKDTNKPDIDCLMKLCDLYEVSPSYLLGYAEDIPLSKDEAAILKEVRQLDDRGYAELQMFLNFQKCFVEDREKNYIRESIKERNQSATENLGHLLNYKDSEYNSMKQKCRNLKKLKKNSYRSYEDITKFLWDMGYGDNICLGYVIDIFYGRRVPDELLYKHIYAYLTNQVDYTASFDNVEDLSNGTST